MRADSPTSGRPPPGCALPPTRNSPGTGERFAGRRNAERAPLLDACRRSPRRRCRSAPPGPPGVRTSLQRSRSRTSRPRAAMRVQDGAGVGGATRSGRAPVGAPPRVVDGGVDQDEPRLGVLVGAQRGVVGGADVDRRVGHRPAARRGRVELRVVVVGEQHRVVAQPRGPPVQGQQQHEARATERRAAARAQPRARQQVAVEAGGVDRRDHDVGAAPRRRRRGGRPWPGPPRSARPRPASRCGSARRAPRRARPRPRASRRSPPADVPGAEGLLDEGHRRQRGGRLRAGANRSRSRSGPAASAAAGRCR